MNSNEGLLSLHENAGKKCSQKTQDRKEQEEAQKGMISVRSLRIVDPSNRSSMSSSCLLILPRRDYLSLWM
jgi:hypothetical protein